MSETLGIIINGVTGRVGYRQHLVRSLLAIRDQGGVRLADGTLTQIEPILMGRNEVRLKEIANQHNIARWSTNLTEALAMPGTGVYFDTQVTSARGPAIRAAIAAGKHIYTEKPSAETAAEAIELADLAELAGVKNGVVHDKLYLPGLRKLKRLVDSGFFGRILSVRGEFGYWVFDGELQPAQRPSWNYRSEDGGGIVLDMFCHWNYVMENIFGEVRSVIATTRTHLDRRFDESHVTYAATADDAAYAIFELDGGVIAQVNSSWTTRVNRDELVEFQVDGTEGSAVAGLWGCRVQPAAATPKAVWNPDLLETHRFRDDWIDVPDNMDFDNGFKVQWEQFIRHVVEDGPHPYDFRAGARGLRLAEAGLLSAAEGRRIELVTS